VFCAENSILYDPAVSNRSREISASAVLGNAFLRAFLQQLAPLPLRAFRLPSRYGL
jgi:hypothetical protein